MELNRNLLIKQLKFSYEQIKSLISKKDRLFSDFQLLFQRLKDLKELYDSDIKLFIELIINLLKTSNMRIFEKCIDCIEKIISLNLLDYFTFPDLATILLNHLFDKSSQNDDGVNYKILNICLILYNNEFFTPVGSNLLLIIRICLFIFLTSLNQSCQNIAKITLIQIMDSFLDRCKECYKRNKEFTNLNEDTFYFDLSKYMKYQIDIVEMSLNNKDVDFLSNYIKIAFANNNDASIKITDLFESDNFNDIKNEKDYSRGKYGWCYNCRKTGNYFSLNLNLPMCSKNCEYLLSYKRKLQNEESLKDDFISVFKSLSILSIKDLKDNTKVEKINIKLREFCLELMYKNLITCGKYYRNNTDMIQVIREYTIDSLVKNCLSNEVSTCKISLAIFHFIMKYYRESLRDQIYIFINNVLIYIMDSENFGFSYKEIVLETLCQFNDNSYFFIELFSNFDCDINDKNILKELLSLICKIIRKHYYKPKYDATFLENERTILSTNCFNFLIDFVKNLDKFVTEKSNICINEINYNYTRTKIEEEEKEARDSLIFKEKITQNRKIKSIIEKGVEKFNLKPSKGIDFLRKNEILPSNIIFEKLKTNDINNEPTLLNYSILYDKTFLSNCDYEDFLAKEISKFLKNNRELKKTKVGEYLCSSNSLNKKCLFYYIELFNFKDLHILEAMRIFFSDFYLIGEGQIVDRIMQHFGQKYHKDNPNLLSNPDIGYYLSFSIIMLQTDLHRPEIVTKMTAQTFCQRIVQLTKCEMSNEFLVDIYNKIQNDPIRVAGMDDNFRIMIKKKKDFDYHNEKVFRSTIDELKKMNPTVVFFTNIDNYHVRNLLESCWSFFLGIFSVTSNDIDNENVFLNCVESILLLGKICCILRLDTISEAFFNTIIKTTNIMEAKEIKQKNIDCIRLLIEFVVQYGPLITNSWYDILIIISNIEYYLTIGGQFKNEGELFEKEVRRKSKIKNPDLEIGIELKNTELICRNIPYLLCDNVFSRTANFDEEGIVSFVSALCKVSVTELSRFYTPRNYSLHKLIEVADYNIYRIQIEWTKIWRLISYHIIYVVNNFPDDIICVDAIDSLRQIVLKLLQKPDLAIFNFQVEFFDPFETIFTHTVSKYDRSESIITCLSYITQNTKNIYSGWIVIFSILKFALKRRYYSIHLEIINIIENFNEDIFLQNFSQEIFKGYIECLSHMFLEENMKDISIGILSNFQKKLIIQSATSKNEENKKFEQMKNFFLCLEDLMKFNLEEYLNLDFILFKDLVQSKEIHVLNYIYLTLVLPQITSAVLNNYDDSIHYLMNKSQNLKEEYNSLNLVSHENIENFVSKYIINSSEYFLIINKNTFTVKHEENYIKKCIHFFGTININTNQIYLNSLIEKLFLVSNSSLEMVENILIHLVKLSAFNNNYEIFHRLIIDKIEKYGLFFSSEFWIQINTVNLFFFDIFTNLKTNLSELVYVKHLMSFLRSFINIFYFLLTNHFDKITKSQYEDCCLSKLYKCFNMIFYNILHFETENKDFFYKISEDAVSIEILNCLLRIKFIIVQQEHDSNDIFDEYIIKSIECYNRIFVMNNLSEEENSDIINIISFELTNLVPTYIKYLSAEHISTLFLYIIDFIDAKNTKIRKSVKELIERLVKNNLITFAN